MGNDAKKNIDGKSVIDQRMCSYLTDKNLLEYMGFKVSNVSEQRCTGDQMNTFILHGQYDIFYMCYIFLLSVDASSGQMLICADGF